MKTIKIIILLGIVNAGVSIDEASVVARNFIQSKNNHLINSFYIDEKNGIDNFYVFNLKPEGFIIVSAQKNIIPIIAYGFEYDINLEDLPPQLDQILDDYRDNISYSVSNNIVNDMVEDLWYSYLNNSALNRNHRNVNPLITANWNQGGQWNNECPGNALVGCVAVAMGQVMYYWKHPVQGSGYSQYYDQNYGPIAINFEDYTYDFDNMLDNQATLDSQLLLYHAGVSVNMDYSESGSGASVCWENPSSEAALEQNFNFIDNIGCESKLNYNDEEWAMILKDQLDNGWPIIYRGYQENDGPGHAWNIDGYDNDYYHCNWGWGGSSNGYFYFNNLNGSGFSFIESQAALINIFPKGISPVVALFDYSIDVSTISFTDLSTEVNENFISSWSWNFGDGNSSSDNSPIHTFQSNEIFEVSLIVTDEYGQDSDPHIEVINLLIGDLNNDLAVDVIDVVIIVNLILDNQVNDNFDADLNMDGSLTVLDIVILINTILN